MNKIILKFLLDFKCTDFKKLEESVAKILQTF